MSARPFSPTRHPARRRLASVGCPTRRLVALIALLSVAWPSAGTAWGQSSLRLVPADAAIYSSMSRTREIYDSVVKSKAFAKLKAMPVVQTGLAQINGRGALSFHETNDYDYEYVQRRSLSLDLRILLKTVFVIFGRKGAC